MKTFEASSLIDRKMPPKDEIDFLFKKISFVSICEPAQISNFGNLLKIYISLILKLKRNSLNLIFNDTFARSYL